MIPSISKFKCHVISTIYSLFSTKPQIKAILFDLDGLLTDTETICQKTVIKVSKEFGIELTQEEAKLITGITARKFYEELLKKKGINIRIQDILQRHYQVYMELLEQGIKPFNGATTLPKRLKGQGYKLAIVSGSTREQIEFILNKIGIREYFDLIVSADDISKSKPDPEGYLTAARILNIVPSECIVLEDSTSGTKAGKACGMKVIGVENLGGQDLSSADIIVKDLTKIADILGKFLVCN